MFPKFVFIPLAEESFAQHTTGSSKNKIQQNKTKSMSSETLRCASLPLQLQFIISGLDYYWDDVLYKSIAWEFF